MKILSPKDALKMIENGSAILIDVRESEEFHESHIPYAMSIPMSIFDNVFHHLSFTPEKAIIFQCKSGGRSGRVCDYVLNIPETGHDVYNLDGGITAWAEAGLIII